MDSPELAQLIAQAEQLSPERHPDQAIALNQRIVQLDPHNAAAYLRLARSYQAQHNFAAAVDACQDALRQQPESIAARRRLERINEERDFYRQAQRITSYDEALARGVANRDQDRIGEALAFLWRALELSSTQSQAIRCHIGLAAAYRSKRDPASLDLAAEQYEWVLRHAPGNMIARRGLAGVMRERWASSRVQEAQERQRKRTQDRAQREHQKQQEQRKRQQRKATHQTVKQPRTVAEAYQLLRLRPPATRNDIKRAYRAQAQVAHPDHGGSHAAMVALNAAYELALASA
jgi:tetratricopeptide (TPR) repeat protein